MTRVTVFTLADDLSGGNYRIFKVLTRLPRSKFTLVMPKNKIRSFANVVQNTLSDRDKIGIMDLLEDALQLPDYQPGIHRSIAYAIQVAAISRSIRSDMLYFPHENPFFPVGFRLSGINWTELLQTTPVVGALTKEDGRGYRLLARNMKYNYGLSSFGALKAYGRLNLFKFGTSGRKLLAVSKSIGYELEKLGVFTDLKILDPGVGVDTSPYSSNTDRPIDIIFFARVTPQKGIFDFIQVVRRIAKVQHDIKALVMGFADANIESRLKNEMNRHNLSKNVELKLNVSRDKVLQMLASAKVMVYPTRFDSFSLSVLEALASATPVIAYGIPAIRMNYNTEAVIKVRPLDVDELTAQTLEVLQNDRWPELGKLGLNFANRFKWDLVAKEEWNALSAIA